MSYISLFKLAKTFEIKVADINMIGTLKQMLSLSNNCIVVTKHLLSFPKYQKSEGLQAIQSQIPNVIKVLQNAINFSSFDGVKEKLNDTLSNISFYTSKGNTGTGYDPITSVREQGYTAPSYYVEMLEKLNSSLKTNETPADNVNIS